MPEYNEARTVIDVLQASRPLVDTVVVVNDGSTDHSAELVAAWMQEHKFGTMISLRMNQGMSGALRTGFHWIQRQVELGVFDPEDLVITIDADGQHRPEEIPLICGYLQENGYDLVLGRRDFSGYPRYKRIGNWGLTVWAGILSGQRFYDVESGFRVFRARLLDQLLLYFTGRRYGCAQELGIIPVKLGFKVDNRFPTVINYYRQGARMRDGFTNMFMGLTAFTRVMFHIRSDIRRTYESLLEPLGKVSTGYDRRTLKETDNE